MTSVASRILLRAAQSPWLARTVQDHAFGQRAVRRFMPGEQLDDAVRAAERLRSLGLGTVFTQLGENVLSGADARSVASHYDVVLKTVKAAQLSAHISVKPTHLGLDVSRDLCAELLHGLLERSGDTVWVDMEDSRYTDVTLDLVHKAANMHGNVGVCLQSYLVRTREDLEALAGTGVAVRLVKGAYNEPADIAFSRKRDVDTEYERLSARLLELRLADSPAPVFGTHDVPLLSRIAAEATRQGVGRSDYEIHMLYGIQSDAQRQLSAAGHQVRVLISYGSAWFPWYMRRLAERPANVWFVVRNLV